MSFVIQVPGSFLRGPSAQARITSSKAVSRVTSKAVRFSSRRSVRETARSDGRSTWRGSGECHRMGCSSSYQGKIPIE